MQNFKNMDTRKHKQLAFEGKLIIAKSINDNLPCLKQMNKAGVWVNKIHSEKQEIIDNLASYLVKNQGAVLVKYKV